MDEGSALEHPAFKSCDMGRDDAPAMDVVMIGRGEEIECLLEHTTDQNKRSDDQSDHCNHLNHVIDSVDLVTTVRRRSKHARAKRTLSSPAFLRARSNKAIKPKADMTATKLKSLVKFRNVRVLW